MLFIILVTLFTFHYVSIKSSTAVAGLVKQSDLHSTMYLLNPIMTIGIAAL